MLQGRGWDDKILEASATFFPVSFTLVDFPNAHADTMSADMDGAYSTLEATPHQSVCKLYGHGEMLPTALGKQVAPHEEKQVAPREGKQVAPHEGKQVAPHEGKQVAPHEGKQVTPHEGKQVALDDGKEQMVINDGIEVVANEDSFAHNYSDHHVQIHQSSKKRRILYGGAVVLVVLALIVLGTIFGLRHKHSAATSFTSPPSSTAQSPPPSPPQHHIAALSFVSNLTNNTRIYFQDNVGQIMEATSTAENAIWSIARTGVIGKNGSAIAAAVSRPGFPLVSHISSILVHFHRYLFRLLVCFI